jgi:iron complex outermembrane receptor protein
MSISRFSPVTVLLAGTLLSGGVQAAEATAAATASSDLAAASAVGEIVVTARHRSENPQKVPIALTVLGAKLLDSTNTNNIAQVALLVPSLTFSFFNARNANLNIRGLGNNIGLANDGLEPGVGFYVDQVYYDRPATTTFDLIDIDQIEVLRGPQGTLFGKNTTAGAVTLTTASPTFHPEVTAEASGGNLGYFQFKGAVGGPIIDDKLAGRLSIATTTREGVLTNVYETDNKVNAYRDWTIRGQLLWTPANNVRVRLIGDYSNQYTNCCDLVLAGVVSPPNGKNFYAYSEAFGYTPVVNPFNRQADTNSQIKAAQETGGVSLEGDWSLPRATLTSITAWRFWNWWPNNDADFTPLSVLIQQQQGDHQTQFSQEFRIASAGVNRIDYVGGLFLFREDIGAVGKYLFGDAASYFLLSPKVPSLVGNGYALDFTGQYNTTSLAAFGQATWHITSQLNLTGGLRYTYDIKDGAFNQVASGGAPLVGPLAALQPYRNALGTSTAFDASMDNGNLSGLATLGYQVTPSILTYVTYSSGFKSGGLNLAQLPPGANAVIAPESIDSVEGGAKTALFDHKITLNADLFWEKDNNYQANNVTALGKQYLSNIPEVKSQGVEVDIQAQPLSALSLYTSVTYDDATYASYPTAPCGLENITAPSCNLSGAPLAGVPLWAVSAGGEFDQPVSLGAKQAQAYFGVDYSYRSPVYSAATDSIYSQLPQLSLFNARLGLRAADSRWDAYLWAKNLFNDNYLTFVTAGAGNTGALYAQLGDPRTWGVTLRFHY